MQKQFEKPTSAALLLSLFTYAATANLDIEGVVRDSVSFDPIGGVKIVLMQDTTQAVITDGLGQFHFVYPSKTNGSRLPSFPLKKAANGQRIYIFNSLGALLGSTLEDPDTALPFMGGKEMRNFGVGRYYLSGSETHESSTSRPISAKRTAAPFIFRLSAPGFATRFYNPSKDTATQLHLSLLPDTSAKINNLNTLLADMILPGEALPHGTVGDWSMKPRLGMGVTPPSYMSAFMGWGQIYEVSTGNPGVNYRVNLRDMRTYALYKSDNQWHLVQSSKGMQGSAYVENFAGDVHKPAGERTEADGSTSVTVGGGYNFHFWNSTGRVSLQSTNVKGLYTTFQARLIPNNFNQADDRAACRIIGSVGGDWWRDLNAQWAADWSNNGDYAIGRFKFIRKEWQSYSAWAGDSTAFRSNPPPLD